MCLYPKLIKNRKYVANKKNKGIIPEVKDQRVLLVPVGCGKCMECKKQKGRAWSVRLQEEIRNNKNGQFVTLTFSNESIAELKKDIPNTEGYLLDNEIATLGVRRFLERWRKKHKKSVKHWLVTELGHNGTENIHLHGIIFSEKKEDIKEIWKYGFVYIGEYVNEATINYSIKYSTKIDDKHPNYTQKILTSPGIGSGYTKRHDSQLNKFNKNGETKETYTTKQGIKINLPIYYRNKIYNEDEREELWLEKLDKNERWVNGVKVDVSKGHENYYAVLKEAQRKNKELGYGDDKKDWNKIKYENERRNLLVKKRLEKIIEKDLTDNNNNDIFRSLNKQYYERNKNNTNGRN